MNNLDLDLDFDPADEEFAQEICVQGLDIHTKTASEVLTRQINKAMEDLKKITPEFNNLRKQKEALEELIKTNFAQLKLDKLSTSSGNVEKQVKVSEVIPLDKLLRKVGKVKNGKVSLSGEDIELLEELVSTVKGKIEKALPKDQIQELIVKEVGDPTYKINLSK